MPYINKLPARYYLSWDKKTAIVQENKLENNKRKARFSIENKDLNISIQTEWYDFPFKNNHTVSDLVFLKVPALKSIPEVLPLVETTSSHRFRTALCSTFVLKDKTKFNNYLPIQDVIGRFKICLSRPSCFQLSDGIHVREVHPSDIIEIIEE